MNRETLHALMAALINGDISPEDHERLQRILKNDAEARAIFRERMDLEASLRTWALESNTERRTSVLAGGNDEEKTPDDTCGVECRRRDRASEFALAGPQQAR